MPATRSTPYVRAVLWLSVLLLFSTDSLCSGFSGRWRYPKDTAKDARLLATAHDAPTTSYRNKWEKTIKRAQDYIADALSQIDGSKLTEEIYEPESGDWGRIRFLENSKVFDTVGVGAFILRDKLWSPALQGSTNYDKEGNYTVYWAGLIVSAYPQNPMVPDVHHRYYLCQLFDAETGESLDWWFGGGTYLSPPYVNEEDAFYYHKTIKDVYDKFDRSFYPKFKEWADDYYVNVLRGEVVGVGGTYLSRLDDRDPEELREFVSAALDAFIDAYIPIVAKRKDAAFTANNKQWQLLRRGCGVEFILMYDADLRFALEISNSTVGKMLILPLTVQWHLGEELAASEQDSREIFRNPKGWV